MAEYNSPVIDPQLKAEIESHPNNSYQVAIDFHYDNKGKEASGFKGNKKNLEQFAQENGINQIGFLNTLPRATLVMNAEQIHNLSKEEYISCISNDDQTELL